MKYTLTLQERDHVTEGLRQLQVFRQVWLKDETVNLEDRKIITKDTEPMTNSEIDKLINYLENEGEW